jgi:hypothetical protein
MFSHKVLKMANFSHSPYKIRDCIFTTCCTIIYKHVYNPNANTRSLFLSSITTLIAEIPVQSEKMRENKRREERDKKRKGIRRGKGEEEGKEEDQEEEWKRKISYQITLFKNTLKNSTHLPFGPSSLYTIVGDQWMGKLTFGHGS